MLSNCSAFFGWKMLENAWQPLGDFWIENSQKCLVAIRRFLDAKC